MDVAIDAFVATWMRDNGAVLDEIVALQSDDPRTPVGAALAAAMATVPLWSPSDDKGRPF